ncbi:MAG: glutamate--tRNA ligase [bacterium]|nr:glutamate--tRNA ligase [bacterium]
MKIRTRIAPSPTGPLHMGNARTALFSYLFSKKEGGDFIVRVEDTDKERSEPKWERDALENLEWLGLNWDEGPTFTKDRGSFGPYRQSERTGIYKEYLEKLLKEKRAYWCFCTTEELDAQRQDLVSRGETPRYSGRCRGLSIPEQEKNRSDGKSAVIRFVIDPRKITFKDIIREEVSFDMALSGDIVIAKNMETPLYNFTVVIDDELMQITHVIRGEDHISNTPKQILIKEALLFKGKIQYAHIPLLLAEDRTKLSKRHGDNSVTKFREEGYLPEAIVNFLVLLGWNPGGEKEIFTLKELIAEFSLDRVHKGGAVFNLQRLDWINGFYIRQKNTKELAEMIVPYLKEAGLLSQNGEEKEFHLHIQKSQPYTIQETGEGVSLDFLADVVALYQERLKKLSEITQLADFFFTKELEYEKELLSWKGAENTAIIASLGRSQEVLSSLKEGEWKKEKIEEMLLLEAEAAGDRGSLLWPLRVSLTGKKASAGPFEVAAVLGKEKTLARITQAQEKL